MKYILILSLLLFGCIPNSTKKNIETQKEHSTQVVLFDTIIGSCKLEVYIDTVKNVFNFFYNSNLWKEPIPSGYSFQKTNFTPTIIQFNNNIPIKLTNSVLLDSNIIIVPITYQVDYISLFVLFIGDNKIENITYLPLVKEEAGYNYVVYYPDYNQLIAERRDAHDLSVPTSRIYCINLSNNLVKLHKIYDFNWAKIYKKMYHSEHDLDRYYQLDKIYNEKLK